MLDNERLAKEVINHNRFDLGDMSELIGHYVEHITYLSLRRWSLGIFLLILTILGVVMSACIGPIRIPPSIAFRILISHIPGFSSIWDGFKEKKLIEIERLQKDLSINADVKIGKPTDNVQEVIETLRNEIRDLENYEVWIWQGRMPRIIVALLVGAGLSTSGVIFQGLVLNPLASSGTLGVSAGSATGAYIFIVLGHSLTGFSFLWGIPVFAFVGGLVTISLVWFVAKSGKGATSPLSLILSGVIVGIFLASLMSFIAIIAEEENLRTLTLWNVGSLASREWFHVRMALPIIGVGILLSIISARDLNALSLGAEQARNLGINVNRSRQMLMITAAILTSGAVSVSGQIGFVGLVVPHTVRMLIGPDHRTLIPFSALGGGIFLLLCDTIGRTLASPLELPVGIVTSLVGAPFFVYIYKTRMKSGAVIT